MRPAPEELHPLFLDSISEGVFTVDNGFIVLVGVGFIPRLGSLIEYIRTPVAR